MDKEEQGHWDHVLMVAKLTVEIDRLQKQAHYHYENGLKKDVEIENLREEIEYLKAHTIHDQYKAESEGEERGYRMGYEDGLADGKGG